MWKKYEVAWLAQGLTFNYQGTEIIEARNVEEAKQRALKEAEKRLCLSKSLINITSIRIIVQ